MASFDAGMDADAIIELLGMEPHPEGGYFAETFRDPAGDRAHSTAIYYLLKEGERSHWHRVDAAEIWHWYAGGPLALSRYEEGRRRKRCCSDRTSTQGSDRRSSFRREFGRRRNRLASGRWSAARWRPDSSSPALKWPNPAGIRRVNPRRFSVALLPPCAGRTPLSR